MWVIDVVDSSGSAAPDDAGRDATTLYSLGSNREESARLQRQADELAPDSRALLDRVELRSGHHALDLGCGPRGVLELLAERTGPSGRVVGIDAEPSHTAMAADFAAASGLDTVECLTADARDTGLPGGSFDLVYARTLLVNVPEPAGVVAEMARLAKPGGWVVAMEPDSEYTMCYPPNAAFTRICEIFPAVFRRHGADHMIGRRVAELFRQAGLSDVATEARVQLYPPGHSRRTTRLDLVRSMRPHIVEMGLATDAELDELDAAARGHLGDPDTVAVVGLFFLTWGRKPQ